MKTRHKAITNRAELRQEVRRLRQEVKEQEKGLREEGRRIVDGAAAIHLQIGNHHRE